MLKLSAVSCRRDACQAKFERKGLRWRMAVTYKRNGNVSSFLRFACVSAKRTQLGHRFMVNGQVHVHSSGRCNGRAGPGGLQSLEFVEIPE